MKPILKVPIKFGVFGALIIITMFFVFFFSDANPLIEIRMFDFFILPIFIFSAIKEFRDGYNGLYMEFWEGMTVGFVTYITLAIVTSLFVFIFLSTEDGTIFNTYIDDRIEILESRKDGIVEEMGVSTYEESHKDITGTTIWDLTLDNFIKKTLVGLMLTIMISVLMRRKEKVEPNISDS